MGRRVRKLGTRNTVGGYKMHKVQKYKKGNAENAKHVKNRGIGLRSMRAHGTQR